MSLAARIGAKTARPGDEAAPLPAGEVPLAASTERYRAAGERSGDSVTEVRLRIQRRLADELGPTLYAAGAQGDDLEIRVRATLTELIAREQTPLAGADKAQIIRDVTDDVLGHGPIESLLRDPSVSEVMVNGPQLIYVERFGRATYDIALGDCLWHVYRMLGKLTPRIYVLSAA